MKAFALIIVVLMLAVGTTSGQKANKYQVGTFLGNQILADGTYTNSIHCGEGDNYTCTGSAGFNAFRAYYVQTDEGVWSFVTDRQSNDVTARQFGITPEHLTKEKPNLLDSLKPGDKVAFRITKDRRIGAGNSYHVFIPEAENPDKEDKFEGTLSLKDAPVAAPKPVDNIKAMCDAHKFSPDDEKKYCSRQDQNPIPVAPAPSVPAAPTEPGPKADTYSENEPSKSDPRMEAFRRMCNSGGVSAGTR